MQIITFLNCPFPVILRTWLQSTKDQQLHTSTIKTLIHPNRNWSNLLAAVMLSAVTHTVAEICKSVNKIKFEELQIQYQHIKNRISQLQIFLDR